MKGARLQHLDEVRAVAVARLSRQVQVVLMVQAQITRLLPPEEVGTRPRREASVALRLLLMTHHARASSVLRVLRRDGGHHVASVKLRALATCFFC